MKKFAAIACVALLAACGQAEEKQPAKAEVNLDSDKAKLSYSIGFDIGQSLAPIEADIDREVLFAALHDRFDGKESRVSAEETNKIKDAFAKKLSEKRMAEQMAQHAKNKADGDAFRAENAKKAGVVTTDSGLQYEVLKEGDGPKPTLNNVVTVSYTGSFVDGKRFDQSGPDTPATFSLNGVIKGWAEGVQLMSVGSKYRFVLPPELAYGENTTGPIGPNSTLVFEVELLEIGEEVKQQQ